MSAPDWMTNDQCNYVTWHLCKDETIPHTLYNMSIPERDFQRLFQSACRRVHVKPFEKKYKHFVVGDKEFQHPIDDDDKFMVFKTKLLVSEYESSTKWLECHWKREMLTPIQFPWSKDVDDTSYVNRTTLKLNNRMFLNFETHYASSDDKNPTHMIYINYNHSSQAESTGVPAALQSMKSLLVL